MPRSDRSARPSPRLSKRLGQHHLLGEHLCRPLVDWLAPAGAEVLEIGPGGGTLTRALLAAGARVTAIERDLAWALHLGTGYLGTGHLGTGHLETGREPGLRLVALDALDLAPDRLPPGTLVAGNLPFNVGTKILERLLPHGSRIPRIGVMVQKEVAERLVAYPGDAAYGALSVLVRAYADARLLGTVRPGSFRPPPKVAAAFVGFVLHPPPVSAGAMAKVEGTIKAAFGQRRKTLRNSLGAVYGKRQAAAMLEGAGIDPGRRAETLGLDDFVRLAAASSPSTVRDRDDA